MWFGEKHREALAILRYGILDNKGFLLLTGDVGTGKTTLINTLLGSLGPEVICATIPDPSLKKLDMLNYIAATFGMDIEFKSKGAFLSHFRKFLLKANKNGKKVLLIIDEAQLLNQEMLEEIRLLSNIEKSDTKLINIFFIGQNEFNKILNRPQNRAVRQRMTLNYNLAPLTPEETERYICHRLQVAGTQEVIFEKSAIQEIFLYSGGFPRRINILCDHALLSGYVKEQRRIDSTIISDCAKELKIPVHVYNRDIDGFSAPNTSSPKSSSSVPPSSPRPASLSEQHMQQPLPASPAPPPQAKRFPWTGILILASSLLLIWAFLFADHFSNTMTNITKRIDDSLSVPVDSPQPIQQPEEEPPSIRQEGASERIETQTIPSAQPPLSEKKTPEPKSPANVVPEPSAIAVEKEIPIESEDIIPSQTFEKVQSASIEAPPAEVKNSSAPKPIPQLPKETIILRFQYDTNNLTPEGLKELEDFSKILSQYPEARIKITGHTDTLGSSQYNQKLSEFRANIIKSFLMGKGIKEDQMRIEGKGGWDPIESNDTMWGRQKNRRVEIKVL